MSLILGDTFIGFNLKVTDACGVMNKKDKKTPYTFCPIGSRLVLSEKYDGGCDL